VLTEVDVADTLLKVALNTIKQTNINKFLVLIYLHITFMILYFYYISVIWMNNIYIIYLWNVIYNLAFLYEYFLYVYLCSGFNLFNVFNSLYLRIAMVYWENK